MAKKFKRNLKSFPVDITMNVGQKKRLYENVRQQNLTPNRLLTKTKNFSSGCPKVVKFILSKLNEGQNRTLKTQSAHINRPLKTEIPMELLLRRNKLPVQ